ncbi:hypothetical protein AYI70_g9543, partial [Smittium culicis]
MKSYIVPNSKKPGSSHILRNPKNVDNLDMNYLPHINTAYQIFWNSVKLAPNSQYLGHRPYDPKTGTYGPYEFITYAQAATRITNLGCGIVHINQKSLGKPDGPIQRNFPVAMYSNN